MKDFNDIGIDRSLDWSRIKNDGELRDNFFEILRDKLKL